MRTEIVLRDEVLRGARYLYRLRTRDEARYRRCCEYLSGDEVIELSVAGRICRARVISTQEDLAADVPYEVEFLTDGEVA